MSQKKNKELRKKNDTNKKDDGLKKMEPKHFFMFGFLIHSIILIPVLFSHSESAFWLLLIIDFPLSFAYLTGSLSLSFFLGGILYGIYGFILGKLFFIKK